MEKLTLKKKPFLTLKKKPFLTLKKTAAVAAVLMSLTACGSGVESAPAQDAAPIELVAYTQAEAFDLCTSLAEEDIPDCLSAAADW